MAEQRSVHQLRQFFLRCRRRVDSTLVGRYRSVFRGSGIEFEGLREYCPGDPCRNLDWNATARFARPYVREYREERNTVLWLLVDVSGSTRFSTARASKRETAAEIAALLALSAAGNGDRVGALLFSNRIERHIPPRRGTAQAWRVAREILTCKPDGTGTDLSRPLRRLRMAARRRGVVFLISDFLDRGFEDALAETAHRHDLTGIVLSDPHDGVLPPSFILRATDLETGAVVTLDGGHREIASAWSRRSREKVAHAVTALTTTGALASEVSTNEPVVRALLRLFAAREARMGR